MKSEDWSLLESTRSERERFLWAMFSVLGRPASYLDIDCQDGWLVRTARMSGCKPSLGVTNDRRVRKYGSKWSRIILRDFEAGFELFNKFELVTYFPSEAMNPELVHTAVKHATKYVVYSSKGLSVFSTNYEVDSELTKKLQSTVWTVAGHIPNWYVLVMRENEAIHSS